MDGVCQVEKFTNREDDPPPSTARVRVEPFDGYLRCHHSKKRKAKKMRMRLRTRMGFSLAQILLPPQPRAA
jgi:hypothetical protein